ncbi:MAG: hypothetical protein GF416_05805 [Candidatus Altiarchaeales archaeon]|nr:hypothetical protein [Candidatus Altiarchaeales archaeon]MBD3416630.1 hypothetical protein [Candidatus Altiarchaeales archaeon]
MSFLEDTRKVFLSAILAALAYPGLAQMLEWTIMPALVLSMTISLRSLSFRGLWKRELAAPAIKALALQYILLTGIILAAAHILLDDSDYIRGFIIMAAVPPAVSVVPFTYLLRGDSYTSTLTEVIAYLLALALTPSLILLLIGDVMDVSYLLGLLSVLIILPMALSRILASIESPAWDYGKSAVNLLFALITYVLIGLNHAAIISDPLSLSPVVAVVFVRTFVPATIVYYIARRLGSGERSITYALFSSYKNNGAAAVIALALLTPKSALPMAFAAIAEPSLIILLQQITRGNYKRGL